MTRQDELTVKGHIELAETPGCQTKSGNTPRFELRLSTEAVFLVASRVAVSDLHFHRVKLPEKTTHRDRSVTRRGERRAAAC